MTQFLGLDMVRPVAFESVQREFIIDTLTQSRRVIQRPGQYWRLSFGLQPTDDGRALMAHRACKGISRIFSVSVPQLVISGQLSGAARALAAVPSGVDHQVRVSSIGTATAVGVLGQFVRLSNGPKIYQVVAAAEDDGNLDLTLFPAVSFAALSGVELLVEDIQLRARYSPGSDLSVTYNEAGLVLAEVSVDEAV